MTSYVHNSSELDMGMNIKQIQKGYIYILFIVFVGVMPVYVVLYVCVCVQIQMCTYLVYIVLLQFLRIVLCHTLSSRVTWESPNPAMYLFINIFVSQNRSKLSVDLTIAIAYVNCHPIEFNYNSAAELLIITDQTPGSIPSLECECDIIMSLIGHRTVVGSRLTGAKMHYR